MGSSRRSVVGFALAFVLLAAGVGPALAHSSPSGSGCRLGALAPTYSYGSRVATAHNDRTGCSNSVQWLEGKLMHVQAGPLPNTNLRTETVYFAKVDTYIHPARTFTSGAVYLSLTRSATGSWYESGTSTP